MTDVRARIRAATQMWLKDAKFESLEAKRAFEGRAYTTSVEKNHSASERFLKAAIVCGTRRTPPRIHDLPSLASEAARRHGTDIPDDVQKSLEWLQDRFVRYPPRREHFQRLQAVTAERHSESVRQWVWSLVKGCL